MGLDRRVRGRPSVHGALPTRPFGSGSGGIVGPASAEWLVVSGPGWCWSCLNRVGVSEWLVMSEQGWC